MISKRSNWICQWKVSGSLFCRNRLHENCLHKWWNKNQYHFTDGNARWTDFIQMQCKKTGFLEENPPISSIGNPRKFLSTTKMCWKSISSEKNLIDNLPWRTLMEKPLLIVSPYNNFPLTIIVWKSLERPQKKSTNWLEARRSQIFQVGIPSRKQIFR